MFTKYSVGVECQHVQGIKINKKTWYTKASSKRISTGKLPANSKTLNPNMTKEINTKHG